ncbi:hypothetical protein RF11_01398 [Thelohanellus kitauei]|uniref:Uncharacterized protein n=1 Tax=Thelohanellus kitauei TaxID=669202 RepID=A0A0C2JR22_THEKT|nr:hypothetical protein RF11_01398 [Thelohanellus kitauei]
MDCCHCIKLIHFSRVCLKAVNKITQHENKTNTISESILNIHYRVSSFTGMVNNTLALYSVQLAFHVFIENRGHMTDCANNHIKTKGVAHFKAMFGENTYNLLLVTTDLKDEPIFG